MDEETATRRARAHIEWGWSEQEVLKDLIGGGCDPALARRLVADAGSDRDSSTRIRGVIDLVLGAIGLIVCIGVTYWIVVDFPIGEPPPGRTRGAGYLVLIPVITGFAGIFLFVRGLTRTLFAKE